MTEVDQAGSGLRGNDISELGTGGGLTRRRFVGYLMAGPVLMAGVRLVDAPKAAAAAAGVDPTTQLPVDQFDLSDLLTIAAAPTFALIKVVANPDSTFSFALPRAEVGQGITTAFGMIIADEIGTDLEQVLVTLEDAAPNLVYNQLTGGSNSVHALFTPVRTAAATVRTQLAHAAADVHGGVHTDYKIEHGIIKGNGVAVAVGSLVKHAAVSKDREVVVKLKEQHELTMIGTSKGRVDAHDIVTGKKVFAMDIQLPGALPAMVCRAPTVNGTVQSVSNMAEVQAMPGVEHVVIVPKMQFLPGGVAVVAKTFGQCIDGVRALKVNWGPGSVAGKSASTVAADLAKAELPTSNGTTGPGVIDEVFTFNFRPGDPLEPNCAVADVRKNGAEIWSSLKSPQWAQEQIAHWLGFPTNQVVAHVAQGGGSFGRHLFCDAAFEAAIISARTGVPIKLMWHRTDSFRHGRMHPMNRNKVRVTYDKSSGQVTSFNQFYTGVVTDFTQGIGEIFTANAQAIPGVNFGSFSEGVFLLTANVPYNFGEVTQELNEIYNYDTFHTSSVRNVYSPDVCTATELMVDAVADELGLDPFQMRQKFIRTPRMLTVLNTLASAGDWGKTMPAGTAQGIGLHHEYKGYAGCLVELDARPQQTNRKIKNGYGGPRVTKATFVIDCGTPVNVLGIQAQMMGGIMDGIAQAMTFSAHLVDAAFLEGSWDNAYYTRQWNCPTELNIIVLPANGNPPGGAGEFGVGTSMAAVACALRRATGTMPTTFPVNYNEPLGYTPFPTVPPIPQSPTDGLKYLGRPLAVTPQS